MSTHLTTAPVTRMLAATAFCAAGIVASLGISPPAQAAPTAPSGEGWVLATSSEELTIYTRYRPGQTLKDYKAEMRINAPMARVMAVLGDIDSMREWFYLMREVRFLKIDKPESAYIYAAVDGIWPVSPRDVVAHIQISQDPVSKAITVDSQSVDGMVPPKAGIVRIPQMHTTWVMHPTSSNSTLIKMEGHSDPGGWIPPFIANFAVTVLPRQAMGKLREMMAKPENQDTQKLFDKNPQLKALSKQLVFP
jgi:START domain